MQRATVWLSGVGLSMMVNILIHVGGTAILVSLRRGPRWVT
jgi:hypothetical protein